MYGMKIRATCHFASVCTYTYVWFVCPNYGKSNTFITAALYILIPSPIALFQERLFQESIDYVATIVPSLSNPPVKILNTHTRLSILVTFLTISNVCHFFSGVVRGFNIQNHNHLNLP